MQRPLEVGMMFTAHMAQERGYKLLKDTGASQLFEMEGKRCPPVYLIIRDGQIVTLTLHAVLARVALYVV
jgi:hypothetical protein